ncbi:uncharacterized protein LOC132700144 isoform X2 [Cylas formicarius]|nr:uncharacterized protein LOC132700144 isoform X2 [Cylas formicarius]XP_060523270.1 uncharacterized protein LOC132700144 isoform X2 [Cylas formicarius]XP_060523271.1 uncharacterized protein LOC132700144 isoform X2 [Cylas formicarius]XP_060523272.1 uncharacterized protein LOC132700144 isoform X2 [Cylas formicarius]
MTGGKRSSTAPSMVKAGQQRTNPAQPGFRTYARRNGLDEEDSMYRKKSFALQTVTDTGVGDCPACLDTNTLCHQVTCQLCRSTEKICGFEYADCPYASMQTQTQDDYEDLCPYTEVECRCMDRSCNTSRHCVVFDEDEVCPFTTLECRCADMNCAAAQDCMIYEDDVEQYDYYAEDADDWRGQGQRDGGTGWNVDDIIKKCHAICQATGVASIPHVDSETKEIMISGDSKVHPPSITGEQLDISSTYSAADSAFKHEISPSPLEETYEICIEDAAAPGESHNKISIKTSRIPKISMLHNEQSQTYVTDDYTPPYPERQISTTREMEHDPQWQNSDQRKVQEGISVTANIEQKTPVLPGSMSTIPNHNQAMSHGMSITSNLEQRMNMAQENISTNPNHHQQINMRHGGFTVTPHLEQRMNMAPANISTIPNYHQQMAMRHGRFSMTPHLVPGSISTIPSRHQAMSVSRERVSMTPSYGQQMFESRAQQRAHPDEASFISDYSVAKGLHRYCADRPETRAYHHNVKNIPRMSAAYPWSGQVPAALNPRMSIARAHGVPSVTQHNDTPWKESHTCLRDPHAPPKVRSQVHFDIDLMEDWDARRSMITRKSTTSRQY